MSTPQPSGSLVATLAWVIPIAGIVLWVAILPSTRTLLRRRFERHTAIEPTVAESVDTPAPAQPQSRRRSEDPEILGFNRDMIRAKFGGVRTDA